jgi:hypothetical protein
MGAASQKMVEFAQVVHVPSEPAPAYDMDSAEQRVTRFFLHSDGVTVRVSVHVYAPTDISRSAPIVVDIQPGSALIRELLASNINYRLRTVKLHDTPLKKASEYALFRGTRAAAHPFAAAVLGTMPAQDGKIRPMLYTLLEMAIKAARHIAAEIDAAERTRNACNELRKLSKGTAAAAQT